MTDVRQNFQSGLGLGHIALDSGSVASFSLNNSAVLGTSGPMIAMRYFAQSTEAINEAYCFLNSVGGTIGNITMRCRVVNENLALAPGTTVRATASTVTIPAAGGRWIKAVFATPYTPTLGEMLWIVWDNTSASPTVDYPDIRYQSPATNWVRNATQAQHPFHSVTSTDGFSTAGTGRIGTPYVVVQGTIPYGFPWTDAIANPFANNKRKRGIKVGPLPVDIAINWMLIAGSSANLSGIQIFDGATGPGGSPIHSLNLGSDTNQITDELIGSKRFSEIVLSAGSTYRLVFTYSANTMSPRGFLIDDYTSFTSLFDGFANGVTLCEYTQDNGAGGWEGNVSILPSVFFGSDRFVAATGGGIRYPQGLSGGLV